MIMHALRRSIKICAMGLILISLVACSQVSKQEAAMQASAPKASAWKSWEATGLVGFRDSKQASSAHFDWQQHSATQFDLKLQGALGIGALAIHASASNVSATNAKGKTVSASSAEALVAQETGWRLPVSNLYYWMRGLPVPGVAISHQSSTQGRLTQLQQAGWTVVYQSYSQVGGASLPSRVVLSQSSLTVTVIINHWQYV